ncbi:hypothetical protein [Salarchaeum japonicum]|uniref:hypothetical protein n=1 Tax=Salarchaeum japonicum TaxID=555573 RepID=UPI003C77BB9F
MQRRKFLAGLGSLTAAGAAGIGTGAFTSVSAKRSLEVQTAGDANALLGIEKISSSANSEYVDVSGDTISIDISTDTDNDQTEEGVGLNKNATTKILDLFRVTNNGTQDVVVYTKGGPDGVRFSAHGSFANSDGKYTSDGTTFQVNKGALSITSNLDENNLKGGTNPSGDEGVPVLKPGQSLSVELFSYGTKDVDYSKKFKLVAKDTGEI